MSKPARRFATEIPLGTADPDWDVGFVFAPEIGLHAIDLRTGERLWQRDASGIPVLAFDGRLFTWKREGAARNQLVVEEIDAAGRSAQPRTFDAVPLPAWADVSSQHEGAFDAEFSAGNGKLTVCWTARAMYTGGASPPRDGVLTAPQTASGVAVLRLADGRLRRTRQRAAPGGPRAVLPGALTPVAHRRGMAPWSTAAWSYPGRGAAQLAADGASTVLVTRDGRTPPHQLEIAPSDTVDARVSPDGSTVLARDLQPADPAGENTWSVIRVPEARTVAVVRLEEGAELPAAAGGRLLYLLDAAPSAPGAAPPGRVIRARAIPGGEVLWSYPLGTREPPAPPPLRYGAMRAPGE